MRGGEQGAQEVCEEGFQAGTMPFSIDCRCEDWYFTTRRMGGGEEGCQWDGKG